MADGAICACGCKYFHAEQSRMGVFVDDRGKSHDREIRTAECAECGLVRQVGLPFSTEAEYVEYYKKYPPVKATYVEKDYAHDRDLAAKRCAAYKVRKGQRVLDVGSGSGAFVDECRSVGADAYGCEIAQYSYRKGGADEYTYRKRFEDVHFPTDHFDMVTCHDTLEHVLDPAAFMRELFRVTVQKGFCKVDMPDFYAEAGAHHWKATEHVWFFTAEQFTKLAEAVGFSVAKVEKPIESKVLFHLVKPEQRRVKVLLPPGIGDAYWSIVKLEAFIEKYKTGLPDVYVVSNREMKHNGHNRAFPFIEMFPFLHSSGVAIPSSNYVDARGLWKEAYSQRGRTVFRNVLGCDYFVSYNGHLRYGEDLEKIDPDLRCDWVPPMFVSLEQERYEREAMEKYGRYIAYHLVFHGTYRYWTDQFPLRAVVESINRITASTGCVPVFSGAGWDKDQPLLSLVVRNVRGAVDLRGQTTVAQLFGLMKGAQAVVGYPSGSSIMGAMLGKKTLIVWNDYYDWNFAWLCVPPAVRRTTYQIEDTRNLTPAKLEERVLVLLGSTVSGGKVKVEQPSPAPTQLKGKADIVAACVLNADSKTFGVDNVLMLRNMLRRYLTIDHKLVCITDSDDLPEDVQAIKPLGRHPEPWHTMEVFRKDLADGVFKDKLVLYLDLDLLLLDRIDDLVELDHRFTMLSTFVPGRRYGNWATGIMLWTGDHSYLYEAFRTNERRATQDSLVGTFISEHLKEQPDSVQMFQAGIYSYKRHCWEALPAATSAVWFHGNPKYDQVTTPWVVKYLSEMKRAEAA